MDGGVGMRSRLGGLRFGLRKVAVSRSISGGVMYDRGMVCDFCFDFLPLVFNLCRDCAADSLGGVDDAASCGTWVVMFSSWTYEGGRVEVAGSDDISHGRDWVVSLFKWGEMVHAYD